MEVMLRIKEATGWNPESIVICGGEDHETPVARLVLTHFGYRKIPDDKVSEIVRSILGAVDGVTFEIPGDPGDYVDDKKPNWMEAGGTTVRARGGGGGEIRIPEGATFEPNGEIHVPPRSLDGSHPNAKKFRRACRSARNAIREMAEKSGKRVELIMLELQGGKE